ncbi:ATP-binding protein [Streptomyces sp. 8N616]|uniref:ATP-binding protein n=1 Tax=Streptomyces sp. 8N616 TaxID=3457414 RepID=UPI003FD65D78
MNHETERGLHISRLPLPHTPLAAAQARRHVRDVLATWGLGGGELAESVELVASELVTNAVRHAVCPCGCTRGVIALALWCGDGRLRVEVGDPLRTPPRWPEGVTGVTGDAGDAGDADDAEDCGGRGLAIVTALGKDWGHHERSVRGKVVWCEFATAEGCADSGRAEAGYAESGLAVSSTAEATSG